MVIRKNLNTITWTLVFTEVKYLEIINKVSMAESPWGSPGHGKERTCHKPAHSLCDAVWHPGWPPPASKASTKGDPPQPCSTCRAANQNTHFLFCQILWQKQKKKKKKDWHNEFFEIYQERLNKQRPGNLAELTDMLCWHTLFLFLMFYDEESGFPIAAFLNLLDC